MNNDIRNAMKDRVLALIRKPQQVQKEKVPMNLAPLALFGFNFMMFFLDAISGVTVGMLTNPLYGALTFLAGFIAMFVNEQLFKNPHARMTQKWIALGGGGLAVLSTLGIGIAAAFANVLDLANYVSASTVEVSMIVLLVCTAFTHGLLWGVYYFTDPSHVAQMKRLVNMAYREQQRQGLADAEEDLQHVKSMAAQLDSYEKSGDLEALIASFEELRGQSLLNAPSPLSEIPMLVDGTPFQKKQQVTPPLPQLDENKE